MPLLSGRLSLISLRNTNHHAGDCGKKTPQTPHHRERKPNRSIPAPERAQETAAKRRPRTPQHQPTRPQLASRGWGSTGRAGQKHAQPPDCVRPPARRMTKARQSKPTPPAPTLRPRKSPKRRLRPNRMTSSPTGPPPAARTWSPQRQNPDLQPHRTPTRRPRKGPKRRLRQKDAADSGRTKITTSSPTGPPPTALGKVQSGDCGKKTPQPPEEPKSRPPTPPDPHPPPSERSKAETAAKRRRRLRKNQGHDPHPGKGPAPRPWEREKPGREKPGSWPTKSKMRACDKLPSQTPPGRTKVTTSEPPQPPPPDPDKVPT